MGGHARFEDVFPHLLALALLAGVETRGARAGAFFSAFLVLLLEARDAFLERHNLFFRPPVFVPVHIITFSACCFLSEANLCAGGERGRKGLRTTAYLSAEGPCERGAPQSTFMSDRGNPEPKPAP